MIIYIIVVLTLLTLASWFLIKSPVLRNIAGPISSALLLLASIAIVANTAFHFGMKQKTTTTTTEIYTAGQTSSPVNILIANQIGTESGNYAMSFRESKEQEKPTTYFVPDQTHLAESVKKSASYEVNSSVDTAKLTKTTTSWQFSSDFYKTLFKVEDSDAELVSEKNEVIVPESSWLVLSADQAKTLAEKQQAMTDEQKQAQQTQLKQTVAQQVQNYQVNHPNSSQDELTSYTQSVTTQLTLNALKSMIQ